MACVFSDIKAWVSRAWGSIGCTGRFIFLSERVTGDVGKDYPSICDMSRHPMAFGPRSVLGQSGKMCINRTYLSLTDGRLCGQVLRGH